MIHVKEQAKYYFLMPLFSTLNLCNTKVTFAIYDKYEICNDTYSDILKMRHLHKNSPINGNDDFLFAFASTKFA